MQALILIGGFGTRLRPLTYSVPKAMVPIANIPFMERMLRYLERHGITHVILTLGYLPDPIREHVERQRYSLKIDYVVEDKPLGTGGAIKNAESLLDEQFLVFNGDILTTINLHQLVNLHQRSNAVVTIALTPIDNPSLYGVVETDDAGRILRFVEKPPIEEAPSNNINAGIYVYRKEVLKYIPEGEEYSVERQLFPQLLDDGAPMYAMAFPDDYWLDIGSVDKYLRANRDVLAGAIQLPIPGEQIQPGVWVEANVSIAPDATVMPPVVLGAGVRICSNARVGPHVALGPNVVVKDNACIEDAVIWSDCTVGCNASVKHIALAASCCIDDGVQISELSAYGRGSVITAMPAAAS